MKYKIYLFILTTIVLIKVETKIGSLIKFVRVSSIQKKIDFEILKIQRGV